MVDPETALPGDGLGQRRDGAFVEIFDGPAGGADQVMVMARLTPHVGGDMTRALEALRQSGADQRVERSKHRGPSDVGVLSADALVEFLRRRFFARLRQHRGDGKPLGRQPDAGLLEGGLGCCLNHTQMILAQIPRPASLKPLCKP